jgi:glycosyltransferase involved in cell wall biosynthesis
MKSIVFISKTHISRGIGGAEVQADLLAQELVKNRWKVYYVTFNGIHSGSYNNYELIIVAQTKNKFYKTLKGINADIYYQKGRKELTHWTFEFCKENNKRFIFAASMNIDCLKHKFHNRHRGTPKQVIRNMLYLRKNKKHDDISLQAMLNADVVLSQTEHQKKLFKQNIGLNSIVFPNLHPLPSKQETFFNANPVVLWLANLKEWKQPEVYLRLVRGLANENCIFKMAGKIYSEKYKKLIQKTKKINPNFEYLGTISFEESNKLIGESDFFVNTSKGQEGFPNTFIQAWLRGVPTVSLQFDPDDMITKYQLGFVANNNYEELKKGVKELILDEELRLKLSENAKTFSTEKFSVEKNIGRFIELIS